MEGAPGFSPQEQWLTSFQLPMPGSPPPTMWDQGAPQQSGNHMWDQGGPQQPGYTMNLVEEPEQSPTQKYGRFSVLENCDEWSCEEEVKNLDQSEYPAVGTTAPKRREKKMERVRRWKKVKKDAKEQRIQDDKFMEDFIQEVQELKDLAEISPIERTFECGICGNPENLLSEQMFNGVSEKDSQATAAGKDDVEEVKTYTQRQSVPLGMTAEELVEERVINGTANDQRSEMLESQACSIVHPLVTVASEAASILHPLVKSSWEKVDPVTGVRRVKAIVDSGASNSCASNELAPELEPVPSEGSRRGQTYAAAGGKVLKNEGEKWVQALTGQGKPVTTRWQVVDVNRPLMSVHQICQNGNIVVFGETGGYIMNVSDGSQTPFGVEDNVYVLDLYLPPAEGFGRQGKR